MQQLLWQLQARLRWCRRCWLQLVLGQPPLRRLQRLPAWATLRRQRRAWRQQRGCLGALLRPLLLCAALRLQQQQLQQQQGVLRRLCLARPHLAAPAAQRRPRALGLLLLP